MKGSLVSIIMPTFNSTEAIKRALDSVVNQTYRDWELIVVDDASSTEIGAINQKYFPKDTRIKYIRLAVNSGPAFARNVGLTASQGSWIALLDDDDCWDVGRLEHLIGVIRDAEADFVYDNLIGYDDHHKITTGLLFEQVPKSLCIQDLLQDTYGGQHNLGYVKPIFRKSFLDSNSIRYDERLRGGEDLLFILEVLAYGAKNVGVNYGFYVYTTQVGGRSGRRSSTTRSTPHDREIGEALQRFRAKHESLLDRELRATLDKRASTFFEAEFISRFRHARYTRNYYEMLFIAISRPEVRRFLLNKLLQKATRFGTRDKIK